MDAIDRLLLDWYEWNLGWQPVRGYPRGAVFGSGFQSSKQWMDLDDLSDEIDQRLRAQTAQIIDSLVLTLDLRLRLAINTAVRNLHTTDEIWKNPRWPDTQGADYRRAKNLLAPEMIVRGLLDPKDQCFDHETK